MSGAFFRITDKLLPFDLLSILILDKLCMNFVFIGIFFSFSFNKLGVILVTYTSTYYMEMK